MPTYEYKCKKCGKVFEWEQKITEDALTKCPEEICEEKEKGEGEVFRMISKNVGLIFNGKGFYLTDYARKGESAASSPNGNGTAHKNGGSDKKTKKTNEDSTNSNKAKEAVSNK